MPNPTFTPNLNLTLLAAGTRGWGDVVNATYSALDGLTALGSLAVTPADVDPASGAPTSLRVKVSAGTFRKGDGTSVAFAGSPGTALPASQVSYVYLDDSGALQVNQSGFPGGANVVPLASVVAGASAVTRVDDRRVPYFSFGASAGSAAPQAAAHAVYAGPTSGSASAASFRALVASDLPPLDASAIATGTLAAARLPAFVASGAGHAPGAVPDPGATAGNSRYLCENGSWAVPPGLSGVTLNTTGVLHANPVTFNVSSGVATGMLTLNAQAANTLFAGPSSGASAVPTFRALAAADLPTRGLVVNSHYGAITTDPDAATVTFDLNASDWHAVTLGGNRTLALANDQVGQQFSLILQQDATGGRAVTWWPGILWPGGTAPALTGSPGKRDVFLFKKIAAGTYLGTPFGLNF